MKFRDIYNRVIQYWPEEISIADGYPAGGRDGYYFPTLSQIYDEVEHRVGYGNSWMT